MIEYQDRNQRKTDGDKKQVLFPCFKDDKEVEPSLHPKCCEYLANVWQEKIGDNAMINWEKILQETPGLLSEEEREIFVHR